jgi:GNAT superfamily N-acetyltransferase
MDRSDRSTVVRTATPHDVPALVPLLLAQLRDHGITARAEALATQVSGMIAHPDQGFVLVAQSSAGVVGAAYVSFARPLEHAGEVAWLEELYVAPDERGRGVGQALLAEACARAEARGCVSVDLEIAADHARAANLYARNGFRSLQRTHWTRPLAAWDWDTAE